MIIIIDGYNLLKSIFPGVRGDMDALRMHFAKILSSYKNKKEVQIQEIIIVYDAGPFSHALREIRYGITVIFSGQKSSADDWIVNYLSAHKNQESLLVSRDRRLVERASGGNVVQIEPELFYENIKAIVMHEEQEAFNDLSSTIIHYEPNNTIEEEQFFALDKQELDVLMVHYGTVKQPKNDKEEPLKIKKAGEPHKLSKDKKKLFRVLKKIQ